MGVELPQTTLEVKAVGDRDMLYRPCVDCGRRTGSFCDRCNASSRISDEAWLPGQGTPLCTICDDRFRSCHCCRGVPMCRPFAWGA